MLLILGVATSSQLSAQSTPEAKAATESKRLTLRVLSYNIHHAEGVDGKLDLPRVAGVIESVQPDIVALQEVDVKVKRSDGVEQSAELARMTGMQHVFGGNIDLQGGHYGNALLLKTTPDKVINHRLPNIDKGEQRGVLDAVLTIQGQQLRILATHLDHRRDPRERLESIDKINDLVQADKSMPSLLIGDLNAPFDSDVLQKATTIWQRTNQESLPTIPVDRPERQIDFILTYPRSGWKVNEVRVLDEKIASDHRAIFAELVLER